MTQSLYDILGVPREATPADIKAAYRKLASKHHPDKEEGDTELMKKIQRAHDVLMDDARRKSYDETGDDSHGLKIESEAVGHLSTAFAVYLDKGSFFDFESAIEFVTARITQLIDEQQSELSLLRKRINETEQRAKHLRRKPAMDGTDLFQAIAIERMEKMRTGEKMMNTRIASLKRAIELANDYENVDTQMRMQTVFGSVMGNQNRYFIGSGT